MQPDTSFLHLILCAEVFHGLSTLANLQYTQLLDADAHQHLHEKLKKRGVEDWLYLAVATETFNTPEEGLLEDQEI